MNLDVFRTQNQTEEFLFSITKKCETLIEKTHSKPPETLEFTPIKHTGNFFNYIFYYFWCWL